jgi:hypothetical protein
MAVARWLKTVLERFFPQPESAAMVDDGSAAGSPGATGAKSATVDAADDGGQCAGGV